MRALAKAPQLSEAGYRTLISQLLRIQNLPSVESRSPERQALDILLNQLRGGLVQRGKTTPIPVAILDWISEVDRGSLAFAFATGIETNPHRNQHLLRLLENAHVTGSSPLEMLRHGEYFVISNLFEHLSFSPHVSGEDEKIVARLRDWVRDPAHPYRAAALMSQRPELFRQLDIQLGSEFIQFFGAPDLSEALQAERIYFLIAHSPETELSEDAAVKAGVFREFKQAHQHALGGATNELLREIAAGGISKARADTALAAIKLASSGLLGDAGSAFLLGVAQSTQTGTYENLLRLQALRRLGTLNTPEAYRHLISRLTDADAEIRGEAARGLIEKKLGRSEAQLLHDNLAELQAQGREAAYLGLADDRFQVLRRQAIGLAAVSGSPANCSGKFGRAQLRLVPPTR